MARVMIIGLDCAPPAWVFGPYLESMPHLRGLIERGCHGRMRSCAPPITVPAWACMTTGRDPGELGLYGFRNRRRGSYDFSTATSADVPCKRLWDYAGEAGRTVAALFVPLTYPPRPVNGEMVSCFLTPSPDSAWAYPPTLKPELESQFGPLRIDVADFRNRPRNDVLGELHAMAEQHFAIARHVWTTRHPDFLMMVEMAPDRLQHAYFDRMDPAHPRFSRAPGETDEGRSFYAFLDRKLGEMLALADDDTTVMVVSDHGARPMVAGFRLNQWLVEQGYLVLRTSPDDRVPLEHARIDWSRTRAFAAGGYYGRVFLNLEGRDPEGTVPPSEAPRLLAELTAKLSRIEADGTVLENQVDVPERAYRRVRGVAPDLCVYFHDLAYRALATVGGHGLIDRDNDTGPDACNHDWDGIFVMAGGASRARGELHGLTLYDVTTTVLRLLGVTPPADLIGRDLSQAEGGGPCQPAAS